MKRFTDEPLQWCPKCENSTDHTVDQKRSDDDNTAFKCVECGEVNLVPLKVVVSESEAEFFPRPL